WRGGRRDELGCDGLRHRSARAPRPLADARGDKDRLSDGDVFLELLGELWLVIVKELPPARAHRARIVAVLLVQLFDEGDVGAMSLSGHEVTQFSSTMEGESGVSQTHQKTD